MLPSDNGTEFINRALLEHCTDQGITFTRALRSVPFFREPSVGP